MKNTILAISVIIGTLIGAGFASGKEIEIFFCKYGIYGLGGIIISSVLIGILIYCVFQICEKFKIETYDQFLDLILEKIFVLQIENKKAERIKSIIKNIVNLFLLFSFFIMVAGFGSYFYQEFSVSPICGAVILSSMCYMTFLKGMNGITKVSSILVPMLIIFIFGLGLQNRLYIPIEENDFSRISITWIISAVLYGSYNTILLIPILFPLKKYINNIKINRKVCTLTVFIIILLATIIYGIILENYNEILNVEIPMIHIISKKSKIYKYLYSALILISIYTSAISARIRIFTKCSKKGETKKIKNFYM